MQVARMRIECGGLPAYSLHHSRITVANVGYIVITVQILAAFCIPQPNPLAFDDVNRVVIKS